MPLPPNNNKESFKLLDLSSDDDSDDLHLEITSSRKKKLPRKGRLRGGGGALQHIPAPVTSGGGCSAALVCGFRCALVCWVLVLTGLAISLHQHSTELQHQFQGFLSTVSTCSDSVNDGLQIIHTVAQEVRKNASSLEDRLAQLELDHKEVAAQVKLARDELDKLSKKLQDAPELVNTPTILRQLEVSVGQIGSSLNDMDSKLNLTKSAATTAVKDLENVKVTITDLDGRANTTAAENVLRDQKIITMEQNLTQRLETLQKRLDTLETPASTTSSKTASTTTSTSTSTAAPSTLVSTSTTSTSTLPPAKPKVLREVQ